MTPQMRQIVLQAAQSWQGTPYHHAAKLPGIGVDCVMLLVAAFQTAGLLDPAYDPRPYQKDWHLHRSEERYLQGLHLVADPVSVPEPADIVLFKFGRCVSHAGIVIAWPLILHAWIEQRMVVQTDVSKSPALLARVAGFYSIRTEQ